MALVRTVHPQARIIGFPRAATLMGYERYAAETGVDAGVAGYFGALWLAAAKFGGKVALQATWIP